MTFSSKQFLLYKSPLLRKPLPQMIVRPVNITNILGLHLASVVIGVVQHATKLKTGRFVIHVFRLNFKLPMLASVSAITRLQLIVQLVPTKSTASKTLVATSVPMVAPLATTTLTNMLMSAMFVKQGTPLTMACALLTKYSVLMVKLSIRTHAMIVQMGVHHAPWMHKALPVKSVHQALS